MKENTHESRDLFIKSNSKEKIMNKIYWLLFIGFILFSIILVIFNRNNTTICPCVLGIYIMMFLADFVLFYILTIKDIGKNIFNFIFRGLAFILILEIFFYPILYWATKNHYISYFTLLAIFIFVWIYIINISDYKVVKFANSIVAVGLAVLLKINSVIWKFIAIQKGHEAVQVPFKNITVSYEFILDLFLSPLFIITVVGGLFSEYKLYHLKKVKNGQEKEVEVEKVESPEVKSIAEVEKTASSIEIRSYSETASNIEIKSYSKTGSVNINIKHKKDGTTTEEIINITFMN